MEGAKIKDMLWFYSGLQNELLMQLNTFYLKDKGKEMFGIEVASGLDIMIIIYRNISLDNLRSYICHFQFSILFVVNFSSHLMVQSYVRIPIYTLYTK
jgi:hypothetical protein